MGREEDKGLKAMLNEVVEQEVERLKMEESILDTITETPRSDLAVLRFNRANR